MLLLSLVVIFSSSLQLQFSLHTTAWEPLE
uniref:Uncharacterized protein n=1 Tax=Anguilla anguilla TaxID=7936 RepID=A0A0E9TEY9_ANGAN